MEKPRLDRAMNAALGIGPALFSFAIIALGVETIVCVHSISNALGPSYSNIPVLPFLPAIPWFAYTFGALFAACGAGLLLKNTLQPAALALGGILFLSTVVLEIPKNLADIGNMSLRTGVFEPLALGCLAWLLPGREETPTWLVRISRYLLALSLIVFGIDHFLALVPIAALIPRWIPWHVFWIAFFGAGFIAAGLSIALNCLLRWGTACIGLMYAIWVFTLHLPRVLGLYGIPGAPTSPAEWSSLFIAIGLWGGSWALAGASPLKSPSRVSKAVPSVAHPVRNGATRASA